MGCGNWVVLKDGVYSDRTQKAIGECEKVPMMIKWRADRGKKAKKAKDEKNMSCWC